MASKFVIKLIFGLLIVSMVGIVGCIEEEREFTLNADGSGKVVYDVIFTPVDFNLDDDESDSQKELKAAVEKILKECKGVDTWKDISYEMTDDGRAHFIGTAFFNDINSLDIRSGGFNYNEKIYFMREGTGQIAIEIRKDSDSKEEGKKADTVELSEVELATKVKEAKFQYNKAKPMMLSMIGTLKKDTVFHLPGRIKEISNFTRLDDTSCRLILDGAKMIEALDKMMADDDWLKQQIRAGKHPMQDGPGDDLVANEMAYGEKAPVRVVAEAGDKILFDYKAEVAEAKKNYGRMVKKLGFDETSPLAIPVVSGTPTAPGSVKVGGVRLVRYSDRQRWIRPFNNDKGYTLSIVIELTEAGLNITEGRVEKAVTDTGQDILSEKEWNRKITWPRLSKDKRAVVFEVNLAMPDERARSIAEVSGVLEYLESAGTKKIDLGVMDFKEGAESNVEGFSVNSIKSDEVMVGKTRMWLKVMLLRGTEKSVQFFDEDGTELKVTSGGKQFSGGRIKSMAFDIEGQFPPRGRIVFEILDGLSKHELPFKLTNISLLGIPIK
ncbi:MAG: hypothetical protein DRP65_06245 [Planctomycetota bacterium]|nr:MAG: hypothetical protein DRP65_06245 [Planctomycetota bacterium]